MQVVKSLFFCLGAALALRVSAPASAWAVLVDLGNSTFDTDTDLEWLDMTESKGLSALIIIFGRDPHHLYAAGWRYASFDEITLFLVHAGLQPPFNGNLWSENYAPAMNLIGLMGATGTNDINGHNTYIQAYAPEGAASATGNWYLPLVLAATVPGGQTIAGASVPGPSANPMNAWSNTAHWLRRGQSPVPTRRDSWGQLKSRYLK